MSNTATEVGQRGLPERLADAWGQEISKERQAILDDVAARQRDLPERLADAWGQEISEKRQAILDDLAARQRAWVQLPTDTRGKSAFQDDRLKLTGADVFWLATRALAGPDARAEDLKNAAQRLQANKEVDLAALHLEGAFLNGVHLEGADLEGTHLEGAFLYEAHLEHADLSGAHLEGARLAAAHLKSAILEVAHLEGADLEAAHLEGADLNGANLKGARLEAAHLNDADLEGTYLEGALLYGVHLENASLQAAHLEGADLESAHLNDADLRRAIFGKTTDLSNALMARVHLDQVILDNVNLSVVDWDPVPTLGDEIDANQARDDERQRIPWNKRAKAYAAATRAYRLLATALQTQGMGDSAARYAERAQIMQRKRCWYERKVAVYLGSLLLAVFAGYGYRLSRVFMTYATLVVGFALVYFALGIPSDPHPYLWDYALISVTAIHGRVFFEQFGIHNPLSWVAAAESVCGIIIESVFAAVLIQKLFSR